MIQDVEIAATSEGRLLGLKVDLLADMGAYLMLVTPGIPILGAFMYPAIYKMDAYDFTCTGVFTTRTPTDAYRGAGAPRRRTPSNGSWTSWPSNSTWIPSS